MRRLFVPERHERLADPPWDEATVRAWIAAFATEARSRLARDGVWLGHPRDCEDGDPRTSFTSVYDGEAGMLWALHALAQRGFAAPAPELRARMPDLLARNR